jgi:nucleoside-diphosphate-sugar epimerase
MANNSKKILITGCSGLIGRQLIKTLQQGNNLVVGIDDNRRFEYIPDGIFIRSSVEDFVKTNRNTFDYIYHMAAINGTTNFYQRPNQVLESNITTDLQIFKFAETNPNTKLIYASTSELVSDTETIPTPEETDVFIKDIHNPRWSYRIPKILGENYLTNSNINYVIVRFFNVYSEYSGSGHFLKDQVDKIKSNVFEIIGADETRSFCYVNDAVDALIAVAETANNDIVNIGSEEELTVKDACDILAHHLGKNPNWKYLEGKPGSVKRRQPSLEKLKTYYPEFNPKRFSSVIERIKDKL